MPQLINSNLQTFALVKTSEIAWENSPASGVERKYLERDNEGEVARASTIVRFAAGSSFPEHVHAAGEEFLVLEGVFSDESGDFPLGSYVRNPPKSRHSPHSENGCTILVKLRQMSDRETERVVRNIQDGEWEETAHPGVRSKPLFRSPHCSEVVSFEKWDKGTTFKVEPNSKGEELYLLEGHLTYNGMSCPAGSWLRIPSEHDGDFEAVKTCRIWRKRGHLGN